MNTGTNTEKTNREKQKEIQREITGEVIQDLKDLVQVQRENRNIKSGSTTGEAVQVLMENREEMHEILEHYSERENAESRILEDYKERENAESRILEHYKEREEVQKDNFVTEKRETEKTETPEIKTKSITEMNTGTNTEKTNREKQKEIQREITGEVIQDLKDLVQVQRENRNIKSGSTTGEAVQVLMENREEMHEILEHYSERENAESRILEDYKERENAESRILEHYKEREEVQKDNFVTEKRETEKTETPEIKTKSITEMNTGTNTEKTNREKQKEIQREITGEVIQDLKDLVQVQRENRNIKSGSTTGEAVQVLMENREEMHEILEHYNEKPAFRQWNEVTKHQVSEILKELTAEIKEEEGYKTVIPVSDISQSYQIHKKTEFIYPQIRNETEEEGQRIPETVIRNQTNISETNYYRKNIEAGKVQETNTYQAGERETERKDIKVIHEMIQTNVQKEVNHIADQVYKKLERKLQNERKRRGL